MSIYLVTYDLNAPGRNYDPVHVYLKRFTHCKKLESVWLIETGLPIEEIRDALRRLIDTNDVVLVVRLMKQGASVNYPCMTWLNEPSRSW
ncbi:hypothetical protein C8R31_104288 [Nitrosospira sp. Nsp2]|nr:hypothetical protein C8R31_104288 [Nitrosospira sp. Nsp2]